jgi:hypothetical protein
VIQDALLADKIGWYLAAHGEDIMTVAVQVENIDGKTNKGITMQYPLLNEIYPTQYVVVSANCILCFSP